MSNSGTVKFFNTQKGFGFIIRDNGGDDLFVHSTNISGNGLQEGDKVQFDIEPSDDGRNRAVNVQGGTRRDNGFNGGYQQNNGYGNQGGYQQNNGYGNQGGYGNYGGNSYGGNPKQNTCFSFRDTGSCRFGDNCKFAHQ